MGYETLTDRSIGGKTYSGDVYILYIRLTVGKRSGMIGFAYGGTSANAWADLIGTGKVLVYSSTEENSSGWKVL